MSIVIVKEEPFRSSPVVNMADDMIRATIIVPKREWYKFKHHIEEMERIEKQRRDCFAEMIGLNDD